MPINFFYFFFIFQILLWNTVLLLVHFKVCKPFINYSCTVLTNNWYCWLVNYWWMLKTSWRRHYIVYFWAIFTTQLKIFLISSRSLPPTNTALPLLYNKQHRFFDFLPIFRGHYIITAGNFSSLYLHCILSFRYNEHMSILLGQRARQL